MNFQQTMEWQRINAGHINRLAKLGDALAVRLIVAFKASYANQLDVYLQNEWMKVADDFCRRDLTITTRRILQDRFGVKIPQDLKRIDS